MNTLENMRNLVESVTGKIEAVLDEREELMAEVSGLREQLTERDKEAVKVSQDMRAELEAARVEASRFEQERITINTKLQGLNDRMIALAGDENYCGG